MRIFPLFIMILFSTILQAKIYKTLTFTGSGTDSMIGEFAPSTLYKVIGKEYPPFYAFWRSDPVFDDTKIDEYEKKLKDYYESLGYFRVKINRKIEDDRIVIDIEKNEPIKIDSIRVHPDSNYTKLLPFKKGDIFTTDKFKSSKETIQRYMMEHAHPKYAFKAKAFVHLDEYGVDLDYFVDENRSCVFGESFITGEGDVKKEIIEDAITYKRGEPFDIRELEKSYDNIYEYGIYDYISLEPKLTSDTTEIPIDITLKTGDTKFLKTSVGYDTDLGARAGIDWTDKNFFGDLKVLDLGFKINEIGYEFYSVYYDPRIILPYIGKITLKDEFKYYANDYDSFKESVWENRFRLGKRFVGLEHYFGILTQKSEITPKTEGFEDEEGNYFINSFFYRVLIDKRDSVINASRGYYISLYLEKSSPAIGSDLNYLKALLELRYIKSLGENSIVAFKTRAGSINENVPIFKRFFTGGSVTNRGYSYQNLGPKDPEGIPLGGVSLVDFLFEIRHRIFFEKFWMVAFYDTSMLTLKPRHFNEKFYDTLGFGIRYLTPIGPLRVDFGFPQKQNGFEFHISIGQVF